MAEKTASRAPVLLWLLFLVCFGSHRLLPTAEAIWLSLPTSGTKCVSEEIQNNVVVLADYVVVNDAHDDGAHHDEASQRPPTISARVTSPYGNSLHHIENVTHGQFAFTTTEAGNYIACFWLDGNHQGGAGVSINLEWRTGIAAKDWESVARKEKIEGVELELRKLEGVVEAIRQGLVYLKDREAEMREVSETTNSRVAWFSIMSLGVCIMVSAWQLWHLRHFFQKKKLI
ncbi:transmembrane emp24 domain-containing protein p24delta3-like [Malania oleifera]|uniref:transmembrane emp24 domain-containing protein p24delta3-like n=1 Tax=Malania oleifera TaxID=397392 RepID=UPI0025AEBA2D|nr:transmembrane emp24 domain-containing protein p24delta3-like [Malania oleifera]